MGLSKFGTRAARFIAGSLVLLCVGFRLVHGYGFGDCRECLGDRRPKFAVHRRTSGSANGDLDAVRELLGSGRNTLSSQFALRNLSLNQRLAPTGGLGDSPVNPLGAAVPEPASLSLIGLAGAALLGGRRRRRRD